jgi:hypothetical protein
MPGTVSWPTRSLLQPGSCRPAVPGRYLGRSYPAKGFLRTAGQIIGSPRESRSSRRRLSASAVGALIYRTLPAELGKHPVIRR